MDTDLHPQPRRAPEGFAPDYDTFFLRYEDGVREAVRSTFGVQATDNKVARAAVDTIVHALDQPDGPDVVERGQMTEVGVAGETDHLIFAYWADVEAYQRWNAHPDVRQIFQSNSTLDASIGRWQESGLISLTHNETNYSHDLELTGLSRLAAVTREKCTICGYWGAARDRIPASAHDDLSPYGNAQHETNARTDVKRHVVRPAGNFCVIRTSQDWTNAQEDHLQWYEDEVEPVLKAGLTFLRENGEDTGALTTRYIREAGMDGHAAPRTCALAYFNSLEALESWTHKHPTHLAIFKAGLKMVRQFGGELGIKLYHEVSVFPAGRFEAEYTNCRSNTGLLGLDGHG